MVAPSLHLSLTGVVGEPAGKLYHYMYALSLPVPPKRGEMKEDSPPEGRASQSEQPVLLLVLPKHLLKKKNLL